jgi:putative Mg2+ transporter-C (MgtC) family protein
MEHLHWELLFRLFVATFLGSIIGAERERLTWAAGLRTHMLVCVGACLLMIVSSFGFADVLSTTHIILDPSRVAAQVVSGIGFLGAGSILLRGDMVRGLTTAASIWAVAAVGLAVGGGLYIEAIAAVVFIIIILAGVKPLEDRLQRRNLAHDFILCADAGAVTITSLEEALGWRGRRITRFASRPGVSPEDESITITITRLTALEVAEVAHNLRLIKGVRTVTQPDS